MQNLPKLIENRIDYRVTVALAELKPGGANPILSITIYLHYNNKKSENQKRI